MIHNPYLLQQGKEPPQQEETKNHKKINDFTFHFSIISSIFLINVLAP